VEPVELVRIDTGYPMLICKASGCSGPVSPNFIGFGKSGGVQ
jgi:hypothetical protein